jgi:hypothetical protein
VHFFLYDYYLAPDRLELLARLVKHYFGAGKFYYGRNNPRQPKKAQEKSPIFHLHQKKDAPHNWYYFVFIPTRFQVALNFA